MRSWKLLVFGLLCLACTAIPVLYVLRAMRSVETSFAQPPVPPPSSTTPSLTQPPAPSPAPDPVRASPTPAPPRPVRSAPFQQAPLAKPPLTVVFRYTGVDSGHGRLARGDLEAPDAAIALTDLSCERVHMVEGGGVCLAAHRRTFPVRHEAILFDGNFRARHTLPLTGVPSRVRISPDGRLAAVTVFESGHSYAAANFSTRTGILDVARGDFVIPDLEKLPVVRDGAPLQAVDLNIWGVTFAPGGDRFYATLAANGRIYLVEGDLTNRRMRVLREGVECPSLSPDGTRIAFKRREGGFLTPVTWRLSVVRLDTLADWTLAETRSVDDQVEWLDNATVLYSLPEAASGTPVQNTWAVAADGNGSPRLILPNAYSLAVVRRPEGGAREPARPASR